MSATEGAEAAKAAGLRYTTDAAPGIRRVKRRGGFTFIDVHGATIKDRKEVARIKALAIPPAYTDVWISPLHNGHLQATGRDARGRKQYRYHKRWRAVRDETKFDRMVGFANALPAIRAAVARDLALPGLPREKLLATLISLLEKTSIRIGNEEYARDNESYGLTTLHEKHVKVQGTTVRFHFRGKSGKQHDVALRDPRIARIMKAIQELPGQNLFDYIGEDGEPHPIHSDDVNGYLRAVAGDDFSAKDFRTWEATVRCAVALAAVHVEGTVAAKAAVNDAVKAVAEQLGNTPAVCRKSYIHPGVIDEFVAHGRLDLAVKAVSRRPYALDRHEAGVVALVQRIAARQAQPLGELLAKSVRAARRKHAKPAKTGRG